MAGKFFKMGRKPEKTLDNKNRPLKLQMPDWFSTNKQEDVHEKQENKWSSPNTNTANEEDKDSKANMLHLAVSQGKKDIVGRLLSENVDVNCQDDNGATPLMKAVEYRQYELLDYLIEQGAEVDYIDNNGDTALHIAIKDGQYDIANVILRQSPNVNIGGKDGLTPLHLAAEQKRDKMVKKILRQGASVDMRDDSMRTPLMLACKKGHLPTIAVLLKRRADPSLKDAKGWTARDYASVLGHRRVAEMLSEHTDGGLDNSFLNFKIDDLTSSASSNSRLYDDSWDSKNVDLPPKLMAKLADVVNKYSSAEKVTTIS